MFDEEEIIGQQASRQVRYKGPFATKAFLGQIAATALFLLVLTLLSCVQAPVTGRSQLILINPEQERAMGLRTSQEILKKERLCQDPRLNAMLERVGWRIAKAANRPDYNWHFYLIDKDKVANAFCLPGGEVFVYTGILKYTVDEEGLATVVGHEVAHALARHGAERMSLMLLAKIGESALQAALRTQGPQVLNAFGTAYGLAAQLGVILPYSRTQEFEADHIGLILMARACYDPRGALRFWKRMMQANKGGQPPVFLSTHPTDQARIQRLRALMPQALQVYQGNCTLH